MCETKPTIYHGINLGTIVGAQSANPGLVQGEFVPAEDCDHFEIAKPTGPGSQVYKCVRDFLKASAQSFRPLVTAEAETGMSEGARMVA
jgi:hypothetical protein